MSRCPHHINRVVIHSPQLAVGIALLLSLVVGGEQSTNANDRPHVVIIVADDLGWADVSFHGTDVKTPNIDRLVSEGVELNRFYVCPVCSPTRAGLMTGRYPIRFGLMRAVIPPWRDFGLDMSEVMLPEVLAKAGYRNRGIFGKWHLGHSDIKYHPLRRGFTEFVGHYNGAIDYFTHEREGELDWHTGYESNHEQGYSTDLIADAAVDFIERHAEEDSPLFCYVPFNAPHSPLQAKKDDLESYAHFADLSPALRSVPANRQGAQGRGKSQRQTLAAMISSMDQGIGRILDTLDDKGIADETIVWFFSDNGGTGTGDNRPLRGAKASVFEGGIRVAAALRWPEKIPGGGKITAPLAYIDVMPTLMRITGITDHGGKPMDGIDALPLVSDPESVTPRDIYSYIGQQGEDTEKITLIEPQWKLIVNGPKITDRSIPDTARAIMLFDIMKDPYEKRNRADRRPRIVDRMMKKLIAFRALQPENAVRAYGDRSEAFKAPPEWKIATPEK